jgi:hypothetical protein
MPAAAAGKESKLHHKAARMCSLLFREVHHPLSLPIPIPMCGHRRPIVFVHLG